MWPASRTNTAEQQQCDPRLDSDRYQFYRGGTQSPDIEPEEEPYRSPTLSTQPPPTELNFFSTIEQAVRVAEGNDRYRICVFFFNDECDECRTIEQTVFLDPEVVKLPDTGCS